MNQAACGESHSIASGDKCVKHEWSWPGTRFSERCQVQEAAREAHPCAATSQRKERYTDGKQRGFLLNGKGLLMV